MFFLLARQASVAVILCRGPSRWWRLTRWDTASDQFDAGQWFRGKIYPEKCDLSPDGKLLVYFAAKHWARPHTTWTAVSRPPYFTALGFWPIGDTWGGKGVFLDDRTVLIEPSPFSTAPFHARHSLENPPGPLRVIEAGGPEWSDPSRRPIPCWQEGWDPIPLAGHDAVGLPRYSAWRKSRDGFTLVRDQGRLALNEPKPSRLPATYTLRDPDTQPVASFQAHWADWDRRGRLVATAGGRVMAATLRNRSLVWRQLAAIQDEQPVDMAARDWAREW